MRYVIVGGIPYTSYTGTGTFLGLKVLGSSNSLEEVKKIVDETYDDSGGLHLVIDTTTCKEANMDHLYTDDSVDTKKVANG